MVPSMKWMILTVIGTALVVGGQEAKPRDSAHKGGSAAEGKDAANPSGQTVVVNQHAPQGYENNHPSNPPGYLHELLLPQNVPNLALVVVGIAGIVTAVVTLRRIGRQAVEMRLQRIEMTRQRHETLRQRRIMGEQLEAMRGQIGQMESAGKQTERIIDNASKQLDVMSTSATHTQELAQQAVRQTELTQSQLELSNRPWISIDGIVPASNLIFDQRGGVIMLATQLRNVGSSVAKHVSIFIDVIIGGVHNMLEVKERVAANLKKPIDSSFDHGKLIFPNQIVADQYPIIIRPEILKRALDEGHFKDSKEIAFELFVCADYQSTFDPARHHQTQNIYYVGRIDKQRGIVMGTFSPAQVSYDMKDIVINYKGFGAYAD